MAPQTFRQRQRGKERTSLKSQSTKVLSRISNEYDGEAKHLEKVSKFLPQDTSVLRADIARNKQTALEKPQEQSKDIKTSTPKDLPAKFFEQKQIAGGAKILGMTKKALKERVKRNCLATPQKAIKNRRSRLYK